MQVDHPEHKSRIRGKNCVRNPKEGSAMTWMECKSCHKIVDSRCFRACCDCGAPLCDDCANEYAGRCPECEDREYDY